MRFDDFRSLVERLVRDVPPHYLDGIVAVEVSPKTVPHPVHGDVYTMGECVPLEWSGGGAELQSQVVLYHGSFAALARHGDFDWREQAWETLSHELRHHLEWRARAADLEAFDWAGEQNFARHEGQPFDPVFYRSGERIAEGVYRVDDDVFIEGDGGQGRGDGYLPLTWHGCRYRVALPAGIRPPLFLSLEGLEEPPPGEVVLVIPPRSSLTRLFRRPRVTEDSAMVEPLDA